MVTKPDLIGQIVAVTTSCRSTGQRRSATARDMDTGVPSTDNEQRTWRANCKAWIRQSGRRQDHARQGRPLPDGAALHARSRAGVEAKPGRRLIGDP
jgi:hypothetical protein